MNTHWVVIFDWDGTLIHSLDLKISNSAQLFHEAFGIDPAKVDCAYRWHSGIPRHELFDAICIDNGLPPLTSAQFQALSKRFTELNLAVLSNPRNTQIVPKGTTKALNMLVQQNIHCYISSSATTEEILQIARSHHLEKYFNEILGSSPGFSKGKEHIRYVQAKENAALEQVVFVGDEPKDIQLGKSAGVQTVAIVGTHSREELENAKPDHIIRSLSELLNILNSNHLKANHNGVL
jgi:phosphoglycolate phosphatase-like HAD superfamily hydrolase